MGGAWLKIHQEFDVVHLYAYSGAPTEGRFDFVNLKMQHSKKRNHDNRWGYEEIKTSYEFSMYLEIRRCVP